MYNRKYLYSKELIDEMDNVEDFNCEPNEEDQEFDINDIPREEPKEEDKFKGLFRTFCVREVKDHISEYISSQYNLKFSNIYKDIKLKQKFSSVNKSCAFVCLLHLSNEHGILSNLALSLKTERNFTDVSISMG